MPQDDQRHDVPFHFEINSVAEFIAFVNFVRGDELTDDRIAALTKSITKTTRSLNKAVKAND